MVCKRAYLVAGVEGLVRVAEVLVGYVLGQVVGVSWSGDHGAVPVTHESVGHHEGKVVRVRPACTLDSDGDVGKRHCVVAVANLGT